MAPLSNQTSTKSGTLFIGLPEALTRITSSTNGLCRSANPFSTNCLFVSPPSTEAAFLISVFSSSTEPMQICSAPSSVLQMGNGVPQNLLRLRFQSTMFSSQLPNLPSPVDLGFHWMVLLSSTIRSLMAVVLMNHASNG